MTIQEQNTVNGSNCMSDGYDDHLPPSTRLLSNADDGMIFFSFPSLLQRQVITKKKKKEKNTVLESTQSPIHDAESTPSTAIRGLLKMMRVHESNSILSIHRKESSEATTTTQRLMIQQEQQQQQQQPIPQLPQLVELFAMLPPALQREKQQALEIPRSLLRLPFKQSHN
jgi:hypothetical protein